MYSDTYRCTLCGTVVTRTALVASTDADCPKCGGKEKPLEHALLAAPIAAYRIWRVQRQDAVTLDRAAVARMAQAWDVGENPFRDLVGTRLGALGVGVTWDAQTVDAECHSNTRMGWTTIQTYALSASRAPTTTATPHTHKSPDRNCGCGIWGLKDEADIWRTLVEYGDGSLDGYAYGVVQMWGRYYEHQRGYRCEHARPVEINVINGDAETAAELERFYECAVQSVPPPAKSLALFKEKQEAHSAQYLTTFQALSQKWYTQLSQQQHVFNNVLMQQSLYGMTSGYGNTAIGMQAFTTPPERTHGTPSTFLECSRRWTRKYEGRDTGRPISYEPGWFCASSERRAA